MKQSLDFRLGQHLTITPQLQQAIRLLQLSSIELQLELREALETNPLLEETEDNAREEGEADAAPAEADADRITATDQDMDRRTLDEETAGESDWADRFELSFSSGTRRDNDELPDFEARSSAPLTLRDRLLWQMRLTPFTDTDRRIAEALIDAVNDDGYLSQDLSDIEAALSKDHPVERDEIEAVLHQIQNFEPLGVGSRDLAECLQLQLRACRDGSAACATAMRLATPENLALLAARDHNQLKRQLRVDADTLQAAIELIQRMNPRPAAGILSAPPAYIAPDIIVKKVRGAWRVELNGEMAPRLRVNRDYERLIKRGNSSPQNKYLQDHLQQARWLIKSLSSRNDTLLKVARTVVDRQRAFFDHGPEAMKPLVLHDIAEIVGMHESTVSRVTTSKYMLTPRGIFELKYFFSSHVATADGGTCSATAIRSMIKKLVEEEAATKPISDNAIADTLAKQGINVARRTVAKYREVMSIPPSSQRRSLDIRKQR